MTTKEPRRGRLINSLCYKISWMRYLKITCLQVLILQAGLFFFTIVVQYNFSLVAQTQGGGGGGKPFKKCSHADVAGACKVLHAEGECSKSDLTRLHRCNLLGFLN